MTDDDKSFVSATEYTAFDIIGRVTGSKQVTDGVSYETGYVYNLAGAVVEETYPSGRKVKNTLDASGDLSMVQSGKCLDAALGTNAACINAAGLWSYARHFSYNAAGAVTGLQLGNGLWESAQFNSRLQPTQIALGATQGATNLLKLDYSYGMTNNNGNVLSQTITVPTVGESSGFVAVQTYNYDSLNRLTEAKETTGAQETWKQTFGYDRYGNRTQFSQTIGGIVTPNTNINHPTIDQTNNRFTTGQGYVYDFNGNIVQDAEGRTFAFNGDDKQTEVRDTATNQIIGQYFYDGSGARVKKVVPSTGETTVFVYDAGGALAAEYSTVVAPVQEAKTSYLTTDHLGSPRVITDGQGNVISRRDFMPFGEEIGAGVGPRTEALKYSYTGSDNIRKRFTGYEKDVETGLDFAEARMYESRHGRFTAVDPLLASASAANPQTFNRYIYTGNNPVNYNDPSGLTWCRNNTGLTEWQGGVGSKCKDGFENVDGRVVRITQGDFSSSSTNGPAGPGSVIYLNANGTVQVLQPSPDVVAVAQGASVQESVQVTAGGSADEIASSGSEIVTTAAEISSDITPRGLLPLPCLGGEGSCGTERVYSNPLTHSPDAPGLKTVEGIIRLAEGCSLIPGLGAPCGIIGAIGRAGQGDAWGAGENLLNVVPFLGILRKADKAVDTVTAIQRARQLGLAGERAAGITGAKKAINIGGRNLFPDEINRAARTLTEVKNVKSLSFTRQLKDYAAYAETKGFKFILITRPGTKLSGPLKMAIANGSIIHRPILPF